MAQQSVIKKTILSISLISVFVLSGCINEHNRYLKEALKASGDNRLELQTVLNHYADDPEKLAAARYLIENMPYHHSYAGDMSNKFYEEALMILHSDMSPDECRDSIRKISENKYANMASNTIEDVKIIKADYLIKNIDYAFKEWKERPWARHLTFDEFCEWLLPYKMSENQTLDDWRDTLSYHFSDSLNRILPSDEKSNTAYGALDIMRNEIVYKINPQLRWTDYGGHSMLSAATMPYMATGSCYEYVLLGSLSFRSVGLPVTIDMVPLWGRNHEGHCWYVLLNDRGMESVARNDITTSPGWGFYPYERFPKVFRYTYSINRRVTDYLDNSTYNYDFDPFLKDVTSNYFNTADIKIPIFKDVRIAEKYAYIAMFSVTMKTSWQILDFGVIKHGKACFNNMGRNMQYIVLGYDGKKVVPISDPFIVYKDGSIKSIHTDMAQLRSVDLRRKYYESYNVVEMRRRLLGGCIQCADRPDFSDAKTLFTIESTSIPDKIKLFSDHPSRYWRYLSSNGTYGSIAELCFFDENGIKLNGNGIACENADQDAINRAYDDDWLSNFETSEPNGNWIGMDMREPVFVSSVRIVPRSDDNDIHPGQEYELYYLTDRSRWHSAGRVIADSNVLHFDSIPSGGLLWLINHTTGLNERPFLVSEDGNVEWW